MTKFVTHLYGHFLFPIEKSHERVVMVYSSSANNKNGFKSSSEHPERLSTISKGWKRCQILKIHQTRSVCTGYWVCRSVCHPGFINLWCACPPIIAVYCHYKTCHLLDIAAIWHHCKEQNFQIPRYVSSCLDT